jgi:hypothetical protein
VPVRLALSRGAYRPGCQGSPLALLPRGALLALRALLASGPRVAPNARAGRPAVRHQQAVDISPSRPNKQPGSSSSLTSSSRVSVRPPLCSVGKLKKPAGGAKAGSESLCAVRTPVIVAEPVKLGSRD